ncbi:glycosyltransferase family 2 protein [Paenibacillus sp. PL91]|uniref:glycosyltransferase family 2 protein n=1 Tax=Paenibacillus sp. PL91 TaxID=2729538 RepID=UPI00145EB1C2|nr:glycosyltransferase [Paenibacillus sp. PL91]MBC9200994.1 glycosyltransferase [Paenibacillus sp. PL91]
MPQPIISVIMPTYSRFEGGYLERTINSVRGQTYVNWELLIVDDGSIDGSEGLIKKYCAIDQRIKHIRLNLNIGLPALTTALGYLKASGDYIAFAFDDTVLYPNHLITLVHTLLRHPEAGFAYGQCSMIMSNQSRQTLGMESSLEQMLSGNNNIPNGAVMIPRRIIEDVGWYDPHVVLKRFCDWDLWIRIQRKYPVKFVPQILVDEYGVGLKDSLGNSSSLNKPLVLKYVKQERDAMLHPKKLSNYNSFRLDFSVHVTDEERQGVFYLQLEHYFRTANIKELIQYGTDHKQEAIEDKTRWNKIYDQNKKIIDPRLLLLLFSCQKYIDKSKDDLLQESLKWNGVVAEKTEYIVKQHAYIEEQWSLLHQKDAYIQHQSAMIQQKDEYIAEQHRLIHHLQSLLQ